jgi:hypothetical protein
MTFRAFQKTQRTATLVVWTAVLGRAEKNASGASAMRKLYDHK